MNSLDVHIQFTGITSISNVESSSFTNHEVRQLDRQLSFHDTSMQCYTNVTILPCHEVSDAQITLLSNYTDYESKVIVILSDYNVNTSNHEDLFY